MTKIDDLHRRWRRDVDYKEAYDALGEEFDFERSRSETRAAAGLSQSQPGKRMKIARHVVRASRAKGTFTD